MNKLTRDEKTVVRAYLKFCHSKNWDKPEEYYCPKIIENMNYSCREQMKEFIDQEWKKLKK